ncbi:MAG: hypothetical protein FJY75_04020 [Candidatus Eisenbacteria bacterium]|uniref:Pilus assembly protein PilP n=1 Tax=Eiseniibacteriota bacterium TaxID=2212470 RepID=A0A937X7J4_UNCEI|nr:hypothetical protein [Candidatus Eisenbacteria bacterium]
MSLLLLAGAALAATAGGQDAVEGVVAEPPVPAAESAGVVAEPPLPAAEVEAAAAGASAAPPPAEAGAIDGLGRDDYVYRSGSRRDPFVALVKPERASAEGDQNRRPGVGDITVTGVVWGDLGRLALAETFWGVGLILREGDKLRDGRVLRITPEAVVLRQHGFGGSRTLTLAIGSGEETGNER